MKIDFQKSDGLVPAIVQHAHTREVLMLGYMNAEALTATQESKHVTFFSRSKNRLWTKGESSGHFLELVSMSVDCDGDTLLIQAGVKSASGGVYRAKLEGPCSEEELLGQKLAEVMLCG